MEWPEYNRRRGIVPPPPPSGDIALWMRKWEFSFSPPLSGVPRLFGSAPTRLDPRWQPGATMCWEGEHLRWSDMDGGGGWVSGVGVCVWGGLFIVPLELLSQTQSPLWGLMRTNWSECNKWITERYKRLYFVGCVCRDPPIIRLLSREHWLASAWSGSLNISLSLSCQFYYVNTPCTQLITGFN